MAVQILDGAVAPHNRLFGILATMPARWKGRPDAAFPHRPQPLRHSGPAPRHWTIHGRHFQVADNHGLHSSALEAVRHTFWRRATHGRALLQGLQAGRDHEASLRPTHRPAEANARAFRDTLCSASAHATNIYLVCAGARTTIALHVSNPMRAGSLLRTAVLNLLGPSPST